MSHDGLPPSLMRRHALCDPGELRVESFEENLRRLGLVAVTAIAVWGLVTLTRWACETGFRTVMVLVLPGESRHGWILVLLVLAGSGFLRGLLARRKEWDAAQGDGMGMALGNIHLTYEQEGDDPTPRYGLCTMARALRKSVMTILTLGAGCSGGLEAPATVIGEGLGAFWAKTLGIRSAYELRICQLAGISSGIATLLHAPFTGALFAAEVAYSGTFLYRKLAYCLFAGVTAFFLNTRALGLPPLFPGLSDGASRLYGPWDYGTAFLIATFFSAPSALLMASLLKAGRRCLGHFRPLWRPVVGAVLTGAIGLLPWLLLEIPPEHVLGMGEITILQLLEKTGPPAFEVWWALLLLLLLKALATATTLGSGGSVGMLVPAMVLGGLGGAVAHDALLSLGLSFDPMPALAIASGIAAGLTAVAGVPLCAITFVLEVFGAGFGPPAMVSCGVCFLLYSRLADHAGLWPKGEARKP